MGPQRWTSCGEENILSWIRGMFVYQGRCAAPRREERRILRNEEGNVPTVYATFIRYKKAWKQPCAVLYQRVEYSTCRGQNHAAN